MTDETNVSNLPASIAPAIAGIPAALVPASVKALDRLLGAAVDIPVAWLEQQKAKIKAKTASIEAVEGAIGNSVATKIVSDEDVIEAATAALLRKEYRRTKNLEAVGVAMIEDMATSGQSGAENAPPPDDVDEDWLNVFERYAESASSERMQKLWGRVLSGEVRKPGKFSLRTLRFLSEFSQADALTFADFCENCFGDMAPSKLVRPDGQKDIRHLIYLESAGLIQGASGIGGLSLSINVNSSGNGMIREGALGILFQTEPNTKIEFSTVTLTPLGQELVALLPQRDKVKVAERVAEAIRSDKIHSCYLYALPDNGPASPMKVLWQKPAPVVEG